ALSPRSRTEAALTGHRPARRGIRMSVTMASGGEVRACSRASMPSWAVATRKPPPLQLQRQQLALERVVVDHQDPLPAAGLLALRTVWRQVGANRGQEPRRLDR